jgi:glycosyltransferase involved in cell wall biosynthesis
LAGHGWQDSRRIAPTFDVGYLEVPDDDLASKQEALRSFIGDEPAFVFINSAAAGGFCRVDPFNAPVLCYVHELARTLEQFERPFRALMARADHVICDGVSVHATLRRLTDLDDDQFSVRPAFIEMPGPAQALSRVEKSKIRKELGWPAGSKLVMGCGVVHWRKQPELFVKLAQSLLDDSEDAFFVWIGGGPDLDKMRALVAELRLSEKVRFIGHRDDFRELLKAADVFTLTSFEDPFPLVCLEAAAVSAPSVIFRETTGMTALVEPEGEARGGLAVPVGDETAYIEAVRSLLNDDEPARSLARAAFDRVHAQFSADAGCADLLRIIRRVAKLRPRVSVVVPNYNCAPYLKQRLQSVADQTFKDYEILLSDDKSVDESRALLSEFAAANSDARLMLAEVNSGSVFNAWDRGIAASTGDLI